MTQINMHEAKTHLSRFVKLAEDGEDIVIATAGKPRVRLVPITVEKRQRIPGRLKGKIWIAPDAFDPMSEEELAAWER